MSNCFLEPLKVGETSTNSQHAGDLNKVYSIQGANYRLVKTGAAISAAGGKVVTRTMLLGVPTGAVTEAATLNDYQACGVIPLVGGISSTTTVAISSYLLVQLTGPGTVLANSTITAPAVFGSTTTSGTAASIDSLVYAPGAVLGKATNTAAGGTAGGQPITCVLTIGDG
jgi:hypothetical protein